MLYKFDMWPRITKNNVIIKKHIQNLKLSFDAIKELKSKYFQTSKVGFLPYVVHMKRMQIPWNILESSYIALTR